MRVLRIVAQHIETVFGDSYYSILINKSVSLSCCYPFHESVVVMMENDNIAGFQFIKEP